MEFGERCEEGSVRPLPSLLQLFSGGGAGVGWGWLVAWWVWGGWDCCLCVIVVQKRLCLFQGFTVTLSPLRDWVGDPPPTEPPHICRLLAAAGRILEELCPSLVSTRHRRYFLPLPFFFRSSPSCLFFLLSFIRAVSASLLHALAVLQGRVALIHWM